jgi:hypothetical protein
MMEKRDLGRFASDGGFDFLEKKRGCPMNEPASFVML